MARLTPQEIAEKQNRRLKGSITDMQQGINRVTTAPGLQARNAKQKWVAKITDAKTHDKWAKNVGEVTLEQWKSDMINKGLGRVAAGIDAARGKLEVFYEKLNTYQDGGLTKLNAMPNLTLEDSVNRATYWIRYMANFKQ